LFGDIQSEINQFLTDEFREAEEQICLCITKNLNSVQLQFIDDGRMAIDVPGRPLNPIKVPKEMGTLGILALTFFTKVHGFFSFVGCIPHLFVIYIMSPFINTIFEQVLKVIGNVRSAAFKTKLQEKINEQWHEIDGNVKSKINGFFGALKNQMEHAANETIYSITDKERNQLAIIDSVDIDKSSEFENLGKRLKIITD
jgi:hypothetical protein